MARAHLKNIIGIVTGFGILIFGLMFCLWQLDIILSGCVWWEASPTGMGWAWYGPGAYQRAPFQCFLIQTTIGQAYDSLFLLTFLLPLVGAVLVFLSTWYWND